ncbi:MAG: hypothetical protein AAF514_03000, partial [Verrucomicrobiota bacterium]
QPRPRFQNPIQHPRPPDAMTESAPVLYDSRQADPLDFPDRWSPMLVKELRTSLRSWLFVTAFLLLQCLLILTELFATLLSGFGVDLMGLSSFFWGTVVVVLVFFVPMRGFGALSTEIRLATMETILLTRLSAWKIAFGKWLAVAAEISLVSVTILPHLFLRYCLGGINLVTELFWLFTITAGGFLMAGIYVGFSAQKTILLRATFAIIVNAFAFSGCLAIGSAASGGLLATDSIPLIRQPHSWALYLVLLSAFLFLLYLTIDLGSTAIAPPGENHGTLKRILGFGLLAISLLALPLVTLDAPLLFFCGCLCVLILVIALTEQPQPVAGIYQRFARFGPPGKFLAWFLAPGWPHGLLLLLGGSLLFAFVLFKAAALGISISSFSLYLASGAALLIPLVIIRLFFSRTEGLFGLYFIIQAIHFTVFYVLIFLDYEIVPGRGLLWLGSWLPFVLAFMAQDGAYQSQQIRVLLISLILFSAALLFLFYSARHHYAAVRKLLTNQPLEDRFTPGGQRS